MSNPYLDLVNELDAGIRAMVADGKLTGSEMIMVGTLVWSKVEPVMTELKSFTHEDQALVMEVYDQLWEKYITPTDIPWVPEPVESQWVKPTAKWLVGMWLERTIASHVANGFVK